MDYKFLYKIKYSERGNYDKIYYDRFNSISTFRYDFTVNDCPAFVVVTTELMKLISDIQRLDKELLIIENTLPTVALNSYKRKCLIDEVKQTNDLEGVASTRKEISDILDKKNTKNSRLTGIVQKYAMLLSNQTLPLSNCSDIRSLYDELVLEEVRTSDPDSVPDGDIFRKNKVYIKSGGNVIHTGVFPESSIVESFTALLASLQNPSYNSFINIAVFHYMFGYIHPFYDGNGRTSRFISSYMLSKLVEPIVCYRLSYAVKKDVKKYYKMFKLTNDPVNKGDITPFTIYFMELIKDILKELIGTFKDYDSRINYYFSKINGLNYINECNEVLSILVQNTLFDTQGLTSKYLQEILSKSDTTMRKIIKELENDGFVSHTNTRPYYYNANLEKLNDIE